MTGANQRPDALTQDRTPVNENLASHGGTIRMGHEEKSPKGVRLFGSSLHNGTHADAVSNVSTAGSAFFSPDVSQARRYGVRQVDQVRRDHLDRVDCVRPSVAIR
jgi:hypothetical protein